MNVKAVMGVLMSVSGTVLAHITIGQAPDKSKSYPDLLNTNPPSINLTNHLANTNLVLKIPQSKPETLDVRPSKKIPSTIGPGAYISRPFTCIVIVPGTQPDDCIIAPTIPTNSIPTIKPKLQFDPLLPSDGM